MLIILFFFFNDTATTEIYTLSLHDALPISITNARIVTVSGPVIERGTVVVRDGLIAAVGANVAAPPDRKSTRLNSSHANISYAVFCLKKKISYHTLSTYAANS